VSGSIGSSPPPCNTGGPVSEFAKFSAILHDDEREQPTPHFKAFLPLSVFSREYLPCIVLTPATVGSVVNDEPSAPPQAVPPTFYDAAALSCG
jgi:hypothetical protein